MTDTIEEIRARREAEGTYRKMAARPWPKGWKLQSRGFGQ